MAVEDQAIQAYLQQQFMLPLLLHILQNHPELMQQAQQIHNQRMAGDILQFPPSANLPAGRQQIRQELLSGKAKLESGLAPSPHPPITMEAIKAKVPKNDNEP